MRRKILALLPWVTAVLWLGQLVGCVSGVNEVSPLSTVAPAIDLYETDQRVTGPDRSHWPQYVYTVPQLGVEHSPTYVSAIQLTNSTARARGEYPTLETVFEYGPSVHAAGMLAEAPLAYCMAGVDIPLFLGRVFVAPPWTVQTSPQLYYALVPPGRRPQVAVESDAALEEQEDESAPTMTLP